MSQQRALYRLQKLDSALDACRGRLREIAAQLEGNAELQAARAEVERLTGELGPREARVKEINLEIRSVMSQSSELSAQLYGGTVGNPKELQDIEHKLDELARRRSQLETTVLELMLEVDELQEQLSAANAHLTDIDAAWSGEQAALQDEQRRIKKEGRALKAERETALAAVDEDSRALYDALRTRRQGLAVAVLHGDMCSGCHVAQTANIVQQVRQGRELATCTSCGRILVVM